MMRTTTSDEELLLALLNTTPFVDGVPTDTLDSSDGSAWLASEAGALSAADVADIKGLRDSVKAVVCGTAEPASLNPALNSLAYAPAVAADGSIGWTASASNPVIARALTGWLSVHPEDGRPARLRACANDECALFLIDRSKSNTARWCSMAVCGNRLKARRHVSKTRDAAAVNENVNDN